MKRFILCPECHTPITLRSFSRAWHPFRMTCPHCKAWLQVRPGGGPIFIGLITLLVVNPIIVGILLESSLISPGVAIVMIFGISLLLGVAWDLIVINVLGLTPRD